MTSGLLVLIPARGGSRGIPRKNLAVVGGRSLVGWAVAAGLDGVLRVTWRRTFETQEPAPALFMPAMYMLGLLPQPGNRVNVTVVNTSQDPVTGVCVERAPSRECLARRTSCRACVADKAARSGVSHQCMTCMAGVSGGERAATIACVGVCGG